MESDLFHTLEFSTLAENQVYEIRIRQSEALSATESVATNPAYEISQTLYFKFSDYLLSQDNNIMKKGEDKLFIIHIFIIEFLKKTKIP